MKKAVCPILMFLFGAALGILSRLLDIHTANLGNIFSQMSVWILIGTLISIFSKTKVRAAVNVLIFCIGMLIVYYCTAELTGGVYSKVFIYGWTAFSLCSPIFAALTWMTQQRGLFPKIISAAILLVTLLISIVLFSGP